MGIKKLNKKTISSKNKEILDLKKELETLKNPKGDLTITESPISKRQIEFILHRTPEEHIHERPGKGGGRFKYVTGTWIKKALNYIFAWRWSFEIVDKGNVLDKDNKIVQIWVQGRLTIRNKDNEIIIIKEQFGGVDVKYLKTGVIMDFGNDMKAASTDALKKCASEIGIAGDVYGANEFKEIKKEVKPTAKKTVIALLSEIKECNKKTELNKIFDNVYKMGFNENQINVITRTIEEQQKICV